MFKMCTWKIIVFVFNENIFIAFDVTVTSKAIIYLMVIEQLKGM